MLRLRKPRVWLAFLVILSIWSVNLRSSDIVTPRYLAEGTLSRTQPWRLYCVWNGILRRDTWMTWHLEGLKFISQSFSHFSSCSRSFCRISESAWKDRARYMTVLSANKRTLDFTWSGRSLSQKQHGANYRALRDTWWYWDIVRISLRYKSKTSNPYDHLE